MNSGNFSRPLAAPLDSLYVFERSGGTRSAPDEVECGIMLVSRYEVRSRGSGWVADLDQRSVIEGQIVSSCRIR